MYQAMADALKQGDADAGVRAVGIIDKVLAQLKNADAVAVYDQTPPNPTEAATRDALNGGA